MDHNPCARVTKPKASQEVVRFLSDDERDARSWPRARHPTRADLYPFVLFALTTGARKGEIAG